jgi:hypothetical protein
MYDHPSQVFIAALADAEQLGLPARRMFARHQAKLGGEITSLAELKSRTCRRRLLEHIGNVPPAEAEERYYAMLDDTPMAA